jgi:K+-sensing histidine kinase KdpD
VSHELRSPLARLNVCLAMIRKNMPHEAVDICERMERDVARIDTLMGQLLTLSRLEAGLSSGERENVNFTLLVQEVAADGDFEAQSLGQSVSLEASSSIVLERADSLTLRSACENIVRNAIHFTRPGTEVKVALGIDNPASSPQVLLTVRDEGPGGREMPCRISSVPSSVLTGSEGRARRMGLGSRLPWKPFVCITGRLSLQISSPVGSRLASGCPRRPPPQSNRLIVGSPWYTRFQTSCISALAVNQ